MVRRPVRLAGWPRNFEFEIACWTSRSMRTPLITRLSRSLLNVRSALWCLYNFAQRKTLKDIDVVQIDPCQLIWQFRNNRVVGTKHIFKDCERLLVQAFGLEIASLIGVHGCKTAQRLSDPCMVGTKGFFVYCECPLKQGLQLLDGRAPESFLLAPTPA